MEKAVMILYATDNTDNTIMAKIKDQLKGGISAMFGEASEIVQEPKQITEEEYQNLESQQLERRKFMTGRRRNDEKRPPASLTDMRTSVIVDKAQYQIVREIALRECMTIKEIIYAMFELGINRYEQKHGKVHVRKPKGEKDLF